MLHSTRETLIQKKLFFFRKLEEEKKLQDKIEMLENIFALLKQENY